MIKDAFADKSILAVGAAVAFCGLTLYAAGQALDFLFRDVDPRRQVTKAEVDMDVIETEESMPDPV